MVQSAPLRSPLCKRALLIILLIGTGSFSIAHAQQKPAPKPFDVAAIKPNKTNSGSSSTRTSHGTFTASNVTTRTLISSAFHVNDNQVSGGPDWINSDRFDISAKTDDESIRDNDLGLSIQPLLADRFHLKFHRETRQEPVLSLVVDKAKPTLVPHAGTQEPSTRTSINGGKATLTAVNVPMQNLCSTLAGLTGRIVLDNTHLNGGFDFSLAWEQDRQGESTLSAAEQGLGMTGPSIYNALQEQLGLKLQHTTGPVEHLVIDSIERPTAN